jgi:predicted kinase
MARLGINLHDEAMRDRLERLLWQLAQDLLRLGQSVILELGFWARVERDEKRLGARALGAGVELYYLGVPIEELRRRIEQRTAESTVGSVPITREQFGSYLPYFEAPQRAELDLFDDPAVASTDP